MSSPVIFVVDKNPIHRNLIRYHLELGRFARVQPFPSGEECLYRMQKGHHPDFIITSLFTGTHSAFEFLLRLRDTNPACRVIFFDSFEDHELPEKLIEAGACDYVGKTRDPDAGISELIKNIGYLIRDKSLQSA
jgi:DNA-binding NarL/FixJ family response regulator